MISNINLKLLNIFISTANSKSYLEASQKLGKSPSYVSSQMSILENQLETKLFNKTNRGVTLTNDGKEFYDYISKGISDIESGINTFQKKNELASGTIRIGCPSHITLYYLTSCIKKAKKDFPNLNIELVGNGSANELLKQLKSNNVDFLLIDNVQLNDNNLIIRKWTCVQNIFVSKEPLKINNIKELENLEYILNFEYSNTHKKLMDLFKKCGIKMKHFLKSDITEVRVDLAKKGIGIAYVMRKSVEKELERHELYEVELPITLPSINISLIYTEDSYKKIDKIFINKYL